MTQRPAGWYDDPENPGQLRYWDGILWTSHVTPRRTIDPAASAAPAASPSSTPPAAERGSVPPGPSAYGQWPYVAQGSRPGAYPARWVTVDGVPLAGWWRRVLAYIVDSIVCTVLATPFTYRLTQDSLTALDNWFTNLQDAVRSGATVPDLPADVVTPLTAVGLIGVAVALVYEIVLVSRTGQTVGRWATGTSVRRTDRPGAPGLEVATRRTLVKLANRLLSAVPFIGNIATVFGVVDVLWPLWDKRRQAIHDLAAGTQVVLGRQPRDR
jgi:uncharacterized RDD family membrane protein YckC